jgi:hypothetical protein
MFIVAHDIMYIVAHDIMYIVAHDIMYIVAHDSVMKKPCHGCPTGVVEGAPVGVMLPLMQPDDAGARGRSKTYSSLLPPPSPPLALLLGKGMMLLLLLLCSLTDQYGQSLTRLTNMVGSLISHIMYIVVQTNI